MTTDRDVHVPYVIVAIIAALTAGFGYAAILVGTISLHIPVGAWWLALAQAHGHAQLFGWAGLFVLGVGLYFVPRLRGTTLANPHLARYALACIATGIALRSVSQPLYAFADSPLRVAGFATSMPQGSLIAAVGRSSMAVSGIVELVGAALIVVMLSATFRTARPLGPQSPIVPVMPFLATAFVSLCVAFVVNAALCFGAGLSGGPILAADWDDALVHLMIFGFIIPVAMSLSVRNLPLCMRLAMPPTRELKPIWAAFITGLCIHLFGNIAHLFGLGLAVESKALALGSMLESAAILIFVWMLDVLLRRKARWTTNRASPPPDYVETRTPTRMNYPDHGEFGRFELLVISAFVWLVFAALVSILNGAGTLISGSQFINPDIERHAITAGFVTLLIFGMAVRMLPGFSGKRSIASTKLVLATFWLGNFAAAFRVLPLFAPQALGAEAAFGVSGAIGWLAVACLGVNLWRTLKQTFA